MMTSRVAGPVGRGVLFLLAFALVAVGPLPVEAQRNVKELKNNLEKLKGRKFMTLIEWNESFRDSLKAAKKKKLPVLAYFTRCDQAWPPCQDYESDDGGHFTSDWWIQASERFVPYINIQSGLNLPEERLKAKILGKDTFLPYIVLMDASGKEIERFRMQGADDLEEYLGRTEELLGARQAVKENRGDKVAKARLTLLEGMRSDKPNMKSLEKAARTEGIEKDLVERFRNFAAEIPVREIRREMNEALQKQSANGPLTTEQKQKLMGTYADKLYTRHVKKGLVLNDRASELYEFFWETLFEGALRKKDRRTATKALDTFERAYGHLDQKKRKISKMRDKLRAT